MSGLRLDLTGPRPRLDLGALPLTDAQRQALAFDREQLVTAGAGAGKTHTLSLRYVALLLELAGRAVDAAPRAPRPDIEAVLVMTFTEKAAQEMAARCYRRLLALAELVREPAWCRRLDQAYGDGRGAALAAALDHLVDTFESARIGTFHSFCARILQEFPAEAATPPDFTVLDEIDTRELHAEVVDGVLAEAYERAPERAGRLVAAVGSHGNARDGLLGCLRKRDVLGPILRQHGERLFGVAELLDLFPHSPGWAHRWLEAAGQPLLVEICEAVALSGGGSFVTRVARPLLGRLDDLLELAEPDAFDVFAMLRDVLDAITTTANNPRKLAHHAVLGTKAVWQNIGEQHRLDARDRLDNLQVDIEALAKLAVEARSLPTRADQQMLGALEVLGELFQIAEKRLLDHFQRERVLDFTGLQHRAVRAVLTHDGLRRRLAARHRWLMVDEFQDTDTQQWALVRALGRPDDTPSDRIFVVGDVKQAIYRFRGGDVSVYRRAARELGRTPLVLPENFRSRPELIDWFNHFFGRLLGPADPERPAYEAPYDELAVGRPLTGGTVTLAVHEPTRADADSATEAEAVARLLASSVLPGTSQFAGLDLLDRTVHPTPPVAILFRTRKRMALFEGALRRHDVPYIVAKGVGFWSRPEVRDLVNLLHGIATGDPISTAGALRSPLLGLSDQDLQDLADQRFGGPGRAAGLARLGEWELDDFAPPRVQRAAQLLARWRHVRHRLTVVALLRRVLVDTQAEHAFALRDAAGQAAANIARLLELAARFDGRGPLGLDDAAQHLLAQVQAEPAESEAPVTPTAARVVLLTVHAAKGLEFPVVVVPECGGRPPHGHAAVVHGRIDGTWQVGCRALDPDLEVRTRVSPGLVGLLARLDRDEQAAESKRLLYVAATRARDHLVLVSTRPKPLREGRAPTTWAEMLASVHGVEDADGQRALTPNALVSPTGLEPGHHDGLRIVELEDWLDAAPALDPVRRELPAPDAQSRALLAPIAARPVLEITPSSLDRFAQDPRTWYRRDRLGVADGEHTPAMLERTLASARGDVIHGLLEDDVADDPDVAVARWRSAAFSSGVAPELVEQGVQALLGHLDTAASDERVLRRLQAPGMPEVRFQLPHDGLVLVGQIDRLWRDDRAGGWVVLDWKSERVHGDPIDAARRHVRQLMAYAWAADKVLRAHGQAGVVRAEVYFTHTGSLIEIGPLSAGHLAQIDAELSAVAEFAARSWATVAAAPPADGSAVPAFDVPMHLVDGGPSPADHRAPWEADASPPAQGEPPWADQPPWADEPAAAPDDQPPWADEPARTEASPPEVTPVASTEPARTEAPPPAPLPAPEAPAPAEEQAPVPASAQAPDDTPALADDPWAALRDLLGTGPASTGTTPLPPAPRAKAAPRPPEPPLPDRAPAEVLHSSTSFAALTDLVESGIPEPITSPPPVRAAPRPAAEAPATRDLPPGFDVALPAEEATPDTAAAGADHAAPNVGAGLAPTEDVSRLPEVTAEEAPPPDVERAPEWVDAPPPTEEEVTFETVDPATPPPPPARPPPRRRRGRRQVPEGQLSLFPPSERS